MEVTACILWKGLLLVWGCNIINDLCAFDVHKKRFLAILRAYFLSPGWQRFNNTDVDLYNVILMWI